MSHMPISRRSADTPVKSRTLDRRQQKAQEQLPSKPVKPHQLDRKLKSRLR